MLSLLTCAPPPYHLGHGTDRLALVVGGPWADLPARSSHLGVVESGSAGSRALRRHPAFQARAHGADVHLLALGASAAYPGMNAVEDPEECRRRLADLTEIVLARVPTQSCSWIARCLPRPCSTLQ